VVRVPLHRKASPTQRVATFAAGSGISLSTQATTGASDEVVLTISATGSGGGGGGGAPTTAKYVTLGTDASLTNERVLTAGSNISIVDNGSGGSVVVSATVPTVPSPASSVVSETGFGQQAANGTSLDYARADHSHGTPALPGHNTLGSLAWANAGHTGSTTSVAAWDGGGTAAVVQATTDETMLVRRAGILQWVPLVVGIGVLSACDAQSSPLLTVTMSPALQGSIV
jgi:hypothetical protein